jgi:MraZ protein
MPKKFRYSLGEQFIITRGLGCLCVFTEDFRNRLETKLRDLGDPLEALLRPDVARLHRHFFWDMTTVTADGQFRVQLTPEQRRYAGIEDEVLVSGCDEFIELWSPAAREEWQAAHGRVEDLVRSAELLLGGGASAPGEDRCPTSTDQS